MCIRDRLKLAIEAKKSKETNKSFLEIDKIGSQHLLKRIFEPAALKRLSEDYDISDTESLKRKVNPKSDEYDKLYLGIYKDYIKQLIGNFMDCKGTGQGKQAKIRPPKNNINLEYEQLIFDLEGISPDGGKDEKDLNQMLKDLATLNVKDDTSINKTSKSLQTNIISNQERNN